MQLRKMDNNLILTGFITTFSGLQEAESANGGTYHFLTLMLRTDGHVAFTCRRS